MILLDTDVLIECLRGKPAAKDWLASSPGEAFSMQGVFAMELLMGCRNRTEQRQVRKFMTLFPVLWPDASDFLRAYDLMASHRLGDSDLAFRIA
jgi:predicted nucleic acid-binding protein